MIGNSLAIIRYLARKSGNTNWYPEINIEQAAQIDILLFMVTNELFDSVEKGRLINTFKMFLKMDLLAVIHLHKVCWGYLTQILVTISTL